jgi:hypothetical protein
MRKNIVATALSVALVLGLIGVANATADNGLTNGRTRFGDTGAVVRLKGSTLFLDGPESAGEYVEYVAEQVTRTPGSDRWVIQIVVRDPR